MRKIFFFSLLLALCTMQTIKAAEFPSKEDKEFYNSLYKLVVESKLDSIKLIVEREKVDFSKYNTEDFNPILYVPAWNENKELVQYLIDKGADAKAKTQSDDSPLHRAAWKGNLDIVKLLVEHGADLNLVYNANGGLTPLCCAAESGNIEVVKYLIEKGANPNYINESSGSSPLRSAAYEAHYDIFLLLAEKQVHNYNWQEALAYAATGGNLDIIKYLIEQKGAKANSNKNAWNEYIIQKAANKYGERKNAQPVAVVKYLVSKGAQIKTINGGDVMDWAKQYCSEEMMEYFLEQGIGSYLLNESDFKLDPNLAKTSWTPLASALDNSNFVLAKYLIRGTKDYMCEGKPLVVFFADGLYNSSHIINLLIDEGVNKEYYTEALVASIMHNDLTTVELLLDAGADLKYLNADKSNLLDLASHYFLSNLLIEKGVDTQNEVMLMNAWKNPGLLQALDEVNVIPPMSADDMGQALLRASLEGDTLTVKYLLRRGANVNYATPTLQEDGEEKLQRFRHYEYNPDVCFQQTALMKNAIQGYISPNSGSYSEATENIQISADLIRVLLEAGADVNMVDAYGRTAIHYTAIDQNYRLGMSPIPIGNRHQRRMGSHGDPAFPKPRYHDFITAALIEYGADLNIQDENGNTPLILAAINHNHGVLKQLLTAGADAAIKNKEDKTVLDYLTDQQSLEVIRETDLWNYLSKDILNEAFKKYFTENHRHRFNIESLKKLIAYGADVNTYPYDKSMNALMYAFDRIYEPEKFEMAQALIDGGIDLNAEDDWGLTAAMILIDKHNTRYYSEQIYADMDFLIKNKLDLNHRSSIQTTVMTIAFLNKDKDLVDYLAQHGAKRDLESEWWYLVRTSHYSKPIISSLHQLISDGVDINMQSPGIVAYNIPDFKQKGITALMILVGREQEDEVKALLQMGANVDLKAENGATALSIANSRRNKKIINLLVQAGAKE